MFRCSKNNHVSLSLEEENTSKYFTAPWFLFSKSREDDWNCV